MRNRTPDFENYPQSLTLVFQLVRQSEGPCHFSIYRQKTQRKWLPCYRNFDLMKGNTSGYAKPKGIFISFIFLALKDLEMIIFFFCLRIITQIISHSMIGKFATPLPLIISKPSLVSFI